MPSILLSLTFYFATGAKSMPGGETRHVRTYRLDAAERIANRAIPRLAAGYKDLTMVSSWRAISSGGVPGAKLTGAPMRT
ncbi:MAG TPA: hypothetical protein VF778_02750, partial [Xanthobacteraceae bacterium]